ncbi:hypothetical protein RYX36_002136 [Vicia faba]
MVTCNIVYQQSLEKVELIKSLIVLCVAAILGKSSEYNEMFPTEGGRFVEFPPEKFSYGSVSTTGNVSRWSIDEFLDVNDFSQNYNYMDGSSRNVTHDIENAISMEKALFVANACKVPNVPTDKCGSYIIPRPPPAFKA